MGTFVCSILSNPEFKNAFREIQQEGVRRAFSQAGSFIETERIKT